MSQSSPPTPTSLQHLVRQLLLASVANTRVAYRSALLRFSNFVQQFFSSTSIFPSNTQVLATFIAFLYAQGYAPSTITDHITAVAFVHKLFRGPDPTERFIIRKLLGGSRNLAAQADTRTPVLKSTLHSLVDSLKHVQSSTFTQETMPAIYTSSCSTPSSGLARQLHRLTMQTKLYSSEIWNSSIQDQLCLEWWLPSVTTSIRRHLIQCLFLSLSWGVPTALFKPCGPIVTSGVPSRVGSSGFAYGVHEVYVLTQLRYLLISYPMSGFTYGIHIIHTVYFYQSYAFSHAKLGLGSVLE